MAGASSEDPKSKRSERRDSRRYPVDTQAEYKLLSETKTSGCGRVLNLSNTGLMLECHPVLRPGLQIEVMIAWPGTPVEGKQIKLHAVGRTIRAEEDHTAVRIDQIAFRLD